jgi:hypothetical protein
MTFYGNGALESSAIVERCIREMQKVDDPEMLGRMRPPYQITATWG